MKRSPTTFYLQILYVEAPLSPKLASMSFHKRDFKWNVTRIRLIQNPFSGSSTKVKNSSHELPQKGIYLQRSWTTFFLQILYVEAPLSPKLASMSFHKKDFKWNLTRIRLIQNPFSGSSTKVKNSSHELPQKGIYLQRSWTTFFLKSFMWKLHEVQKYLPCANIICTVLFSRSFSLYFPLRMDFKNRTKALGSKTIDFWTNGFLDKPFPEIRPWYASLGFP